VMPRMAGYLRDSFDYTREDERLRELLRDG